MGPPPQPCAYTLIRWGNGWRADEAGPNTLLTQATPTEADRRTWAESLLGPWPPSTARLAITGATVPDISGEISVHFVRHHNSAEYGYWVAPGRTGPVARVDGAGDGGRLGLRPLRSRPAVAVVPTWTTPLPRPPGVVFPKGRPACLSTGPWRPAGCDVMVLAAVRSSPLALNLGELPRTLPGLDRHAFSGRC